MQYVECFCIISQGMTMEVFFFFVKLIIHAQYVCESSTILDFFLLSSFTAV